MYRVVLAVAAVVALAGPTLAQIIPQAGTVQNKFIVTYSSIPDPTHKFSFYTMPRTTNEAKTLEFSQVSTRDEGKTTVWCRSNDYRVCVLFDGKGSVAGIQLSVEAGELQQVKAVLDIDNIPEWTRQTFMGRKVYSAITYFVHKDVVSAGGRPLGDKDLTAPDGIYILQTDKNGIETGRLHVSTEQKDAESAGFFEQACFAGMGKHYFQNLTKESKCEDHRPYFMLYGPKTKKLNGYGYVEFGKPSKGRGWYEAPSALAAKAIAPNSPACIGPWNTKYGVFTMHVFFIENPNLTKC